MKTAAATRETFSLLAEMMMRRKGRKMSIKIYTELIEPQETLRCYAFSIPQMFA